MDKRPNLSGFLTQAAVVYGSVILILNIFCVILGDGAREYSTIFSLGSGGLSVRTNMEFLAMSVLTVALRRLFLTDDIIKNVSVALRTALMLISVFAVAVIFIILFGWFDAGSVTAWIMFILSFGVSVTASTLISARKEKEENEMLNIALNKIKEEL